MIVSYARVSTTGQQLAVPTNEEDLKRHGPFSRRKSSSSLT